MVGEAGLLSFALRLAVPLTPGYAAYALGVDLLLQFSVLYWPLPHDDDPYLYAFCGLGGGGLPAGHGASLSALLGIRTRPFAWLDGLVQLRVLFSSRNSPRMAIEAGLTLLSANVGQMDLSLLP